MKGPLNQVKSDGLTSADTLATRTERGNTFVKTAATAGSLSGAARTGGVGRRLAA